MANAPGGPNIKEDHHNDDQPLSILCKHNKEPPEHYTRSKHNKDYCLLKTIPYDYYVLKVLLLVRKPFKPLEFHIMGVHNQYEAIHLLENLKLFNRAKTVTLDWWHDDNPLKIVYHSYMILPDESVGFDTGVKDITKHSFMFLKHVKQAHR